MSKYQAYIDRVTASGNTYQEDVMNSTKRQAYEYIMSSPTLVSIDEMELEEQSDKTFELKLKESKSSIVSDVDSFYKRTILFTPDDGVRLGSYMDYKGRTYLVTKTKEDEIYPQADVEFCNYEILIKGKDERFEIGKDEFNKPEYEYIAVPDFTIPCVATSKIYSILDNSQIPLPEGAINIFLPYHKEINVPINYEFDVHGDTFQVTTINKTNLLKDVNGELYGFIEIRGQRGQKK